MEAHDQARRVHVGLGLEDEPVAVQLALEDLHELRHGRDVHRLRGVHEPEAGRCPADRAPFQNRIYFFFPPCLPGLCDSAEPATLLAACELFGLASTLPAFDATGADVVLLWPIGLFLSGRVPPRKGAAGPGGRGRPRDVTGGDVERSLYGLSAR